MQKFSFRALVTVACAGSIAALPALAQMSPPPAGAGSMMMKSNTVMAPLTVTMNPQNGSGESGTIKLVQSGPRVVVMVRVNNEPKDAIQPMHIHTGTCANLGGVAYPLKPLVDGKSDTVLSDVTLASLVAKPMAINSHKSAAQLNIYTACGNIVAPS